MICPNCGTDNKIDQYPTPKGPIWCRHCGLSAPNKERYNPFNPDTPPALTDEEDGLDLNTFDGFGQYLTRKEQKAREALAKSIGTLKIPYSNDFAENGVEVQVQLMDTTTMGSKYKEYRVGDVRIKAWIDF